MRRQQFGLGKHLQVGHQSQRHADPQRQFQAPRIAGNAIGIRNEDPAGPEQIKCPGNGRTRIVQQMQDRHGQHRVIVEVRFLQVLNRSACETGIENPGFGRTLTGNGNHFRGNVQRIDPAHPWRNPHRQQARPAGHIQHHHIARKCGLDHPHPVFMRRHILDFSGGKALGETVPESPIMRHRFPLAKAIRPAARRLPLANWSGP